MIDLRSIIDTERKARSLTDYALAKAADCDQNALRDYLDGRRECRSDVLERIIAALGLSLSKNERTPDA